MTKYENAITWLIEDLHDITEDYPNNKSDMERIIMKAHAYVVAIKAMEMLK